MSTEQTPKVSKTKVNFDVIPDDREAYRRREYWEQRYASQSKEETFDWFKGYAELKELLNKILPNKQDRILMLGCGNSALSEEMYADGYSSIDNVDFSETVIKQMRERTVGQTGLRWHVMDIRELKFEDETFDVVLDKGTMDALMCERGDVWSPSEELCREVAREVDEVVRVLKPGGRFVYITFGQPHFRKPHLKRPCWEIEQYTLGDMFHYYCYVMTKRAS